VAGIICLIDVVDIASSYPGGVYSNPWDIIFANVFLEVFGPLDRHPLAVIATYADLRDSHTARPSQNCA
jgi:hypothetical protein